MWRYGCVGISLCVCVCVQVHLRSLSLMSGSVSGERLDLTVCALSAMWRLRRRKRDHRPRQLLGRFSYLTPDRECAGVTGMDGKWWSFHSVLTKTIETVSIREGCVCVCVCVCGCACVCTFGLIPEDNVNLTLIITGAQLGYILAPVAEGPTWYAPIVFLWQSQSLQGTIVHINLKWALYRLHFWCITAQLVSIAATIIQFADDTCQTYYQQWQVGVHTVLALRPWR